MKLARLLVIVLGLQSYSFSQTEFDPLIADIAAAVSQDEFTSKWQILDDFETRFFNRPENDQAAQWIYDTLESYGLQVESDFYFHEGQRRNIVGIHEGVLEPDEIVYMVAHIDSVNRSGDQAHAPGADDNASGVAAFLEAARVLSKFEFSRTIKFVGFNSEERGFHGSRTYVAEFATKEKVIGCINIDMIAYPGDDEPNLRIYTDQRSQSLAFLMEDACETYTPEEIAPLVSFQSVPFSDHQSFLDAGLPAIFVFEGGKSGHISPWYHTDQDRIENYEKEFPTAVTRAATAAVAQAAMVITFTDCNENGVSDLSDLSLGTSSDRNLNNIPDECEANQIPGDCNQDGVLNISDAVWLLGHLFLVINPTLPCEGGTAGDPGPGELLLIDWNGDDIIDLSDAVSLLARLFQGGPTHALGRDCTEIPGCPVTCQP